MISGTKPLAADLCCGLGGWTEGLQAEGYDVIGFDIEQHVYGEERYPGQLVVQDLLTVHGRQLRDFALIVASPPCQEFSYMAMPFSRGKRVARGLRGADDFPEGYKGSRTIAELTRLVDACFRIQREASEAAGHHIPMVLENVRGAVDWIGRPQYNYGSFYLWGDVPVFMPKPEKAAKVPGFRFDGSGQSFQTASVEGTKNPGHSLEPGAPRFNDRIANFPGEGLKHGGDWFSDPSSPSSPSRQGGQVKAVAEGRKGAGAGAEWFDGNLCVKSSNSPARKRASAMIAKIPEPLSRWIGRCYHPRAGTLTEGPDRF